jgi:transcriptional regulatory C-terminal domain protein
VDAEIPVLILSSYNEYCVPSLKSGTADFIRKEADIEEICARIAAVWQRHASGKTNDSAGETVLRLSELTTFHTDSFTLRIGPNIIPLTGALGEVLVLLCRPPRQCRAATDICRQLWHNDSKSKITLLQNYISQLRKLLTADPALHIVSLYNKGYYLQINGE